MFFLLPDVFNFLFLHLRTERGADQTATELNLGRSVALFFLKSLSSNDKIGVVTISNVAEFVETDNVATDGFCRLDKLYSASRSTKMLIERHLNRIHHSNDVSRVDVMSGVIAARKMIDNSDLHESVQVSSAEFSVNCHFLFLRSKFQNDF